MICLFGQMRVTNKITLRSKDEDKETPTEETIMRRSIVTNGPWNYGGMSGSGIPAGHIVHQPFRNRDGKLFKDGKGRTQKGDCYDVIMTHAEHDAKGLEHGYTKLFTRNYGKFVMSRAARKRGYQTDDYFYNLKKNSHS